MPLIREKIIPIGYKNDQLYTNKLFRRQLMEKITMIGIQIEKLFSGIPQDIEGVYSNDEFYVVQTRPQV